MIGALIVYDITDLDSFDRVQQWVKELKRELGPDIPIVIAGNKCDMPSR
jgi:GTPase SAR1 family protein